MPIPVIVIFDVGKTNKKLFLFNEKYAIVYEENIQLSETVDEDGDPCEDLSLLTEWIKNSVEKLATFPEFIIKAINFSAYGASMIHLNKENKALMPLYNYLKPYPENLSNEFYEAYGGQLLLGTQTASPVTGNLNAGLQLYRIKKQNPLLFQNIHTSLHLPQYLSFLVTGRKFSDMTSIGCHTALWDFQIKDYHHWVYKEEIYQKLALIKFGEQIIKMAFPGATYIAGIGLHDSSAALIPYLKFFTSPFALISTGTWCITLNPFNHTALTEFELQNDCLAYISYQGQTVKASRLFAGFEHDRQVKYLSLFYSKPIDFYKQVSYDSDLIRDRNIKNQHADDIQQWLLLNLDSFNTYEEAYHELMKRIVDKQIISTNLVLRNTEVKQIYVDGGFSKNKIYMNLLAQAFPDIAVFASTVAQSTALGAAIAMHHEWNTHPLAENIIQVKRYKS